RERVQLAQQRVQLGGRGGVDPLERQAGVDEQVVARRHDADWPRVDLDRRAVEQYRRAGAVDGENLGRLRQAHGLLPSPARGRSSMSRTASPTPAAASAERSSAKPKSSAGTVTRKARGARP